MRTLVLAIAVAISGTASVRLSAAQPAVPDRCGPPDIARRFPTLSLPFRIDEVRWHSDESAASAPLPVSFVDECLQQDPTYGRFFAVGRVPVGEGRAALTALILLFSGPEDGYDDVDYLLALDSRGRLRSSLALAVFSGGGAYTTSSEATLSSLQDIRVQIIHSERDDADPTKVARATASKSCFMVNRNGLPIIQACP